MSSRTPARRSNELGFSLVEMLVVLGIMGVLMGVGIFAMASARSAGRRSAAIAAAHMYATAADDFARDHDGRFPGKVGTKDWPDGPKGPVADILGATKNYLRNVPESLQDGKVKFSTAPLDEAATLDYQLDGTGYRIVVRVPGNPDCAVRGGATTSTAPTDCGRR